jgi:inner membrane protein
MLGISDLRGIKEEPVLIINGKNFKTAPATFEEVLFSAAITVPLELDPLKLEAMDFSLKLPVKGSSNISFLPTGKTTSAKVSGNWPDPSFGGAYIPENRNVTEKDFSGEWKVLHFNRSFPQQWKGNFPELQSSVFGVGLLMPVDQYQKSIRTAKYAILIILLTFISLFIVEISCRIRIHPFQYLLIGSALIVYYVLLLSLSEQLGFDIAYLIASTATVILISLYATSFIRLRNVRWLFSSLLVLFYGFIYGITQLQDYALLMGSIGLFMIIAVLMYVSRKINWYKNEPAVV